MFYKGSKIEGSGGGGGSAVIESLSVTPTTSSQTITAPSGTDGYSPVNVAAVTSSIDANITAGNIVSGVSILGVNGSAIELNATTESVTPTTSSQTVTPTSPYNGFSSVTVNGVTAAIDNNITAGNIKDGVTILGVTGSYTGGSANIDSLIITPTTSSQTITASGGVDGYSPIAVSAVTSSIDANITAGNIKKDVVILGVTGSYEGSGGGGGIGITREVSNQGVYQMPASSFTFSLPNNATDVGDRVLYYAFVRCTALTSVDLSALTTASGVRALYSAFNYCTALTSVDLSALTTVSGDSALYSAFSGCTALTSVDLSALTTVSGDDALSSVFSDCTALTSVDLSALTTASGARALYSAFSGCTALTSVDLSALTTASGDDALSSAFNYCTALMSVDLSALTTVSGAGALSYAFSGCTALTDIYFRALTTTSFGSNTNQFSNMMWGTGSTVTHTIHFPSNMESTISGLDGYPLFGGESGYVVLAFDLPATS